MPMHTIETAEGITFHMSERDPPLFTQPAIGERGMQSIAGVFMRAAADKLADYVEHVRKVSGDPHLTQVGRSAKLEPLADEMLQQLANSAEHIASEATYYDKLDAELTAVPRLMASDAVAAAEDVEIRQWWRSQPLDTRAKLLEKMQEGPGYERVVLAMLRTAIPVALDHELTFMRDLWRQQARLNDPAKAEQIDFGRSCIEWGKRGLLQVAGMATAKASIARDRMLRTFATIEKRTAAEFYGFTREDYQRVRAGVEYEMHRAARKA